VDAVHINWQILNLYGVGIMASTNMMTRIFLILLELEFVSMQDVEGLVITLIFVKISSWLGLYNCVIYITIERYAALKFSADYETNTRVFIPIAIMIINSIVSCSVACLLLYNMLNGAVYMLVIFCMTIISCLIYSRISRRNKEDYKKVTSFQGEYSVSHRWQVKDNVR
ncbi:hypothetical protein PMAYCL1PPCAC_17306, partial [Pristionchus mayeri]